MQLTISRRSALRSLAAMTALPALQRIGRSAEADTFPPVRAITRGPRHHWFGYYDKLEFDRADRFVLGRSI